MDLLTTQVYISDMLIFRSVSALGKWTKLQSRIILVAIALVSVVVLSRIMGTGLFQDSRPLEQVARTTSPAKELSVNEKLSENPLFFYSGSFKEQDPKPGPLDPFADRVFLMLKSGATVIQNRLPPHVRSTLRRWPHHAVYADVETEISGVKVIDILKWLPEDLLERHRLHLGNYFDLRTMLEEQWQWELDDLDGYPGWLLDKYKNVPMLAHAWLNALPQTEWFIFIDADSYIMQRGLLEHLRKYNSSEPHYIGRAADWEAGVVNKKGEEVKIPFAHGGSGVAISRGAMKNLFGPDPHSDRSRMDVVLSEFMDLADPNIAGDALVAMMLFYYVDEIVVEMPWGRFPFYDTPFQGSNTRDIAVGPEGWCLPLFSWHHLSPSEVDLIYEYEQTIPLSKKYVTFADIYRDFIMPYVVDERENWNAITQHFNGPWEKETALIHWKDHLTKSKVNCRTACEEDERCLLWVFERGHCQLELGVVFRGVAVNTKMKKYQKTATSGWMVERIREKRREVTCDPLHKFQNGTWSDEDGLSEGYLLRTSEIN